MTGSLRIVVVAVGPLLRRLRRGQDAISTDRVGAPAAVQEQLHLPGAGRGPLLLVPPPVLVHHEQLYRGLGAYPGVDALEPVVVPSRHLAGVGRVRLRAEVEGTLAPHEGAVVVPPRADGDPMLAAEGRRSVLDHACEVVDGADQPVVPAGHLAGRHLNPAVNRVEGPELPVLLPHVPLQHRAEGGEDAVGDVGKGQPPDPLAALQLVPLQVRLGASRRTSLIARPSSRVDRHVVRPLQAPARLEHAEGEVENAGRHAAGEERAKAGRGGPGELPYAPRWVGVPPRADLAVGARQPRSPLDGVVAVLRVEGLGAVLELPHEVAFGGVAASYVLDRYDVPAGCEVPRRRGVGLGGLVIRGALEQHRVTAAGGRSVDVSAEHSPVPRLHRHVLQNSYVESAHRYTPIARSDVSSPPGEESRVPWRTRPRSRLSRRGRPRR